MTWEWQQFTPGQQVPMDEDMRYAAKRMAAHAQAVQEQAYKAAFGNQQQSITAEEKKRMVLRRIANLMQDARDQGWECRLREVAGGMWRAEFVKGSRTVAGDTKPIKGEALAYGAEAIALFLK